MYSQNGHGAKGEYARHKPPFPNPKEEKEEKEEKVFGSNWRCLHQNTSTRQAQYVRHGFIQKHVSGLTIAAQSFHLGLPKQNGETTSDTSSDGLNGRPDSTYGISAVTNLSRDCDRRGSQLV